MRSDAPGSALIALSIIAGCLKWIEKPCLKLPFVEDKYIRILRPIMYRYGQTIWGYGFKVFPENEGNNPTGELFSWLR